MNRSYLAFLPAAFAAVFTGTVFAQTEQKTYSLTLSDPDKPMLLDVEMHHGSVKIEGYDGKTVEIQARMLPLTEDQLKDVKKAKKYRGGWQEQNKTPRSREGLRPVSNRIMNLEIEEKGNEVEISSERSSYMIELVVQVPANASVEAQLHRGEKVEIVNVSGAIEVETWRSNIIATGISGPIVAETHQSDIVVNFAGFNDASPSSLSTYSGDIDLTVAQAMRSTINIKSYQGEILSGLDVSFSPTDSEVRSRKEGKQEIVIGGQLSGDLNGGGQQLSINTYSGDMYLRKPAG